MDQRSSIEIFCLPDWATVSIELPVEEDGTLHYSRPWWWDGSQWVLLPDLDWRYLYSFEALWYEWLPSSGLSDEIFSDSPFSVAFQGYYTMESWLRQVDGEFLFLGWPTN